ncbi:MAG TPA: MarR family transcriptional regulator [Pseudonocardiaceae bacterium]|nr:MarR family transcriptional regulator [Pseudonocardiaceae bacterium]
MQLSQPGESEYDHVDRVRQLWAKEAPELDTTPIAVIARLGRAHAYADRALHAVFAAYGLTRQSFDVLASLRRIGAPYQITPTELYRALMRTSGAITHTLHQLEYAGLIERVPNDDDGRSVLVALTPAGVDLVDRVGPEHLANERGMLAPLTPEEQATLAALLRRLLIAFERDQASPEPRR